MLTDYGMAKQMRARKTVREWGRVAPHSTTWMPGTGLSKLIKKPIVAASGTLVYWVCLWVHVFLTRAVTKISSCRVNTTSRQGIKHLGISFGSIFLLFSYAGGRVLSSRENPWLNPPLNDSPDLWQNWSLYHHSHDKTTILLTKKLFSNNPIAFFYQVWQC